MRLLYNRILPGIKVVLVPSVTVIHPPVFRLSTSEMNFVEKNRLYLRHDNNSDQFQATFNWSNKSLNINREFNLNRRIKERLSDFFGRMKTNIEKVVCNKVKRKKKSLEDTNSTEWAINVTLLCGTSEIHQDIICEDIFFSDMFDINKLTLKIMDISYDVVVNAPWVTRLVLPSSIMAGYPVYPVLDIKFGDKKHSRLNWYRLCNQQNEWVVAGKEFVYTPSVEDIGQKLKLSCVPGNGKTFGLEVTVEANVEVGCGPGVCPFISRHAYTKEILPLDRFRVVSYNILADLYADTDTARNELFSYCPPHALSLGYRKQLYLKEILGYNGDIICLQEVDVKVFENELQDVLGLKKLNGILTRKGTTVSEGVATFYNTEKFRLLDTMNSELGEDIDVKPIYKNIWTKIKDNNNLKVRFKERATVLQVVILESLWNPKQKIVVGNTHLYFHPDADHIRLLQAGMILAFLEDIIKQCKLKYQSDNVSLIMCGDFNSTPDSGIYQLMTTNHVSTGIIDWKSKAGEEVIGLELMHPFLIDSAYGTPQYTNYTVHFSACLDYIYYQRDKLNVLQVVPLPEEDELKANVAIPSITFPSDHIALVANFEWKQCK